MNEEMSQSTKVKSFDFNEFPNDKKYHENFEEREFGLKKSPKLIEVISSPNEGLELPIGI